MRMANRTRRVLVGPFVTDRNRYASQPDTYALDENADKAHAATEALPRQFISNYWDISPLFSMYSHLCMLVSDPRDVGLYSEWQMLSIGVVQSDSVPKGGRWIAPRLKVLPEGPNLDLIHLIETDPELSGAKELEVRGYQRLFHRGDPELLTYSTSAPTIPLPIWLENFEGVQQRKAEFDAFDGSDEKIIGERLFWIFSPAPRIRRLAREFWGTVKNVSDSYVALHMRMEFLYSPFESDKCDDPMQKHFPSINICTLNGCPPHEVVRKLTYQIERLQSEGKLKHFDHLFVARDFGIHASSYSLRDSPLDGITPREAGLHELRERVAGSYMEHMGEEDQPTNSLVDLVLLTEATDCIRLGSGSFGNVVNFYRKARGKRPCRVFLRLDEISCELSDDGEAVLERESGWRVLTGLANLTQWWENSLKRREMLGVEPLSPWFQTSMYGEFYYNVHVPDYL